MIANPMSKENDRVGKEMQSSHKNTNGPCPWKMEENSMYIGMLSVKFIIFELQ